MRLAFIILFIDGLLFVTTYIPINIIAIDLNRNENMVMAIQSIVGKVRPATVLVLASKSCIKCETDALLGIMASKNPTWWSELDSE